jgi:hypothetical protein
METLTFEAVMKDKSLDGQPQLFKEEVKVWMDLVRLTSMTMSRYKCVFEQVAYDAAGPYNHEVLSPMREREKKTKWEGETGVGTNNLAFRHLKWPRVNGPTHHHVLQNLLR